MTPQYLVDTSAWARFSKEPTVKAAVLQLNGDGRIAVCAPVALEVGFSARNLDDWDSTRDVFRHLRRLDFSVHSFDIASSIQRALWAAGLVRAVGAMDTLISAVAIEHHAIVVHYDGDFEYVASVEPALRHQWVVPRGSIA
jgi:predicted nucleic acid-binding protein